LEVVAMTASEWCVELTLAQGSLLYQWTCALPQMTWQLVLDRMLPEDCTGNALFASDNGAVTLKADCSPEGMALYGVPSPPLTCLAFGLHEGVAASSPTGEAVEAERMALKLTEREEEEALAAQIDEMYSNEQA